MNRIDSSVAGINRAANQPSRRQFLGRVGRSTAGAALLSPTLAGRRLLAAPNAPTPSAEPLVKTLYESLTRDQRRQLCLPYDHPRRRLVSNNWAIVEPTIGQAYTPEQREMIRGILDALTADQWDKQFLKQMADDAGGLDHYHAAIFGKPGQGKSEWVLTGRHLTLRADGNGRPGLAFGGPMMFGHAPRNHETSTHSGNVFSYQARRADQVFHALDGKQRRRALLPVTPPEDQLDLQGRDARLPGLTVADMSPDQRELVGKVMEDLLAPFRPEDRQEVMRCIQDAGTIDAIHMSFYKQGDLGDDCVWDIWRLEGPAFVWHLRRSPHVHCWINVCTAPEHSHIEPLRRL